MLHKDHPTIFEINGNTILTEADFEGADIKILDRKGQYIDILFKNRIIKAKLLSIDMELKRVHLNVNGFDFSVHIQEPIDQLVKELGFLATQKHSVKEILSPMPGLVVNIFVTPGQNVQEGENLLSLEAMKMENIIKSPGTGQVKNIRISPSQAVVKNQILIEFE